MYLKAHGNVLTLLIKEEQREVTVIAVKSPSLSYLWEISCRS